MGKTIQATIIGAFTFTAAFLWRDVINEFIELFVPNGNIFFYKLLAALFATALLVVAVYLIFKVNSKLKRRR